MTSALGLRKLENEIITLSLIRLFCEKFGRIIKLKDQPTLSEMLETYYWIRDHTVDTVDASAIKDLIRCRQKADQAFSRSKPLPPEINKESQKLARDLKDCYNHLTQTTNWKIKAGNLQIGRKVKKFFPSKPTKKSR